MDGELNPGTTVGRIAANNPSAAKVFAKYRIDFCCGGGASLKQACEQKNLSPAALLGEIEQAAAKPGRLLRWNERKLSELAEHIVLRYHTYLRSELPRLDQLLEQSLRAHPGDSRDLWKPLQTIFRQFTVDLTIHMNKEEAVLFPWIEELEAVAGHGAKAISRGDSLGGPIRALEHEHDSASGTLGGIRRLTSCYQAPPDAGSTVFALYEGLKGLEEDLRIHVHLENSILFPRARNLEESLRNRRVPRLGAVAPRVTHCEGSGRLVV